MMNRFIVLSFVVSVGVSSPAAAQAPLPNQPPPPAVPPAELDRIVSPIALYPDPLIAQVLGAATFSEQVPDAARWADEHHYLSGPALTSAITADQLPWDPSVQALLPFPSVLDMMASDMPWTQEVGNAFLGQPGEVMDAVQRQRRLAYQYGYLRSGPQMTVTAGPYIEIQPVNPAFVVVPYYNPAVVFVAPVRGVVVSRAVVLGFGVAIGPAFAPWGWGTTRFEWGTRRLIVNDVVWGRTWVNRAQYVHPYTVVRAPATRVTVVEQHRAIPRSEAERRDERAGQKHDEHHRK